MKDALLVRPPNNTITIIKSMFNKRPGTVYFPYPGFLKIKRYYESEDRLIKYS